MCPLKREQATRVSYNTLTHSIDSIVEIGRKSRSWIKRDKDKHGNDDVIYQPALATVRTRSPAYDDLKILPQILLTTDIVRAVPGT